MVYVKKYKVRPRRYKRKTRVSRSKKLYSKPLAGLPYKGTFRFRYAQEFTLNPAAAGIAVQVFRANSLFDPDFTGVGHQPNGFDQMMAYYSHFTVISSKLTFKFVSASANNVTPGYIGVWLTNDGLQAASQANVEDLLESRFSTKKIASAGSERNYFGQPTYINKTFNSTSFFGTSGIVNKEPYRGNAAANPAEQAFFECWAASINGIDTAAMTYLAVIDYVAVLTEPREISQS